MKSLTKDEEAIYLHCLYSTKRITSKVSKLRNFNIINKIGDGKW